MSAPIQNAAISRSRVPLLAKILLWFFLNMLLLAVCFVVLAHGKLHFGLDSLVAGPAGGPVRDVIQLINGELRDRSHNEWAGVLERYSSVYEVQFILVENGKQIGGSGLLVPEEVLKRAAPPTRFQPPGRLPPPGQRGGLDGPPGDRPGEDPMMGDDPHPGPPEEDLQRDATLTHERSGGGRDALSMMRTENPTHYWLITHLRFPGQGRPARPMMATLLVASDNVSGNGLFFDIKTWVLGGAAVIVVSVLFWIPLVRGITSSLSRMTRATEKIAEGNFEVRTQVHRRDELGSLSEAIDRMALRLSGFVGGQKRFLGDIAHELCSPIARIQFALGILEQRADENQLAQLKDLREEVEQMSALVNELLSFSKASIGSQSLKLKTVVLRSVVEKSIARESVNHPAVQLRAEVPENLQAQGDFDLLLRAISNILRNAIHYSGAAGEIVISASETPAGIVLLVEDCGPGIPPDSVEKVFDPFYRVDASRDRETGGVGLGLSIVKTCVESCGGKVRCENRQPTGLRMMVTLSPTE